MTYKKRTSTLKINSIRIEKIKQASCNRVHTKKAREAARAHTSLSKYKNIISRKRGIIK